MSQRPNILVPILFLFAIGATAQTRTTNTSAGTVATQDNRTATTPIVAPVQLNEPAELFMSHLQSDGLLEHVFMKITANLAPTHVASTAQLGCITSQQCTSGLVCCHCISDTCVTQAECNLQCQK